MYHWVEHTAELELRIEAETPEAVFADALAALAELLANEHAGGPASFDVELTAADRATLLVDWLGELVYLAETKDFVPERTHELAVDENRVTAKVEGHVGRPSPLVKAVTYHGLELKDEGGVWKARLVLDV